MSFAIRKRVNLLASVICSAGLVVDPSTERVEFGVDCTDGGPGAKQSFKEECDINRIMAKSEQTGVATWLNERAPQFGEFAEFDFQANMNMLVKAQESFDALPSGVRKRFHNDPAEFIAFMDDKENLDEAIKLGLVLPPKEEAVPEPMLVRVVSDSADKPK